MQFKTLITLSFSMYTCIQSLCSLGSGMLERSCLVSQDIKYGLQSVDALVLVLRSNGGSQDIVRSIP